MSAISMKVNTSARQDVALINAVLKLCKESDKVALLAVSSRLKSHATILDGRALHDSPNPSYEERLRAKRYYTFCDVTVDFLRRIKMLVVVDDVIESLGRPMEVTYVRTTTLGAVFLRLPNVLQRPVFVSIVWIWMTLFTVKKYRWVASVVSVLTAAFHWTEAHNLTHVTIVFSVLVGLVAALIVGWLASLFNSAPIQSDDDPIV